VNINNDPQKLVMFVGINAKIGELKSESSCYELDGKQKLLAIGMRGYSTSSSTMSSPSASKKLPAKPSTLKMQTTSPLWGKNA